MRLTLQPEFPKGLTVFFIWNFISKFIFSDNSTNGSYIKHNEIELFFHQERAPLLGSGFISLGEPSEKNTKFLLKYSIECT